MKYTLFILILSVFSSCSTHKKIDKSEDLHYLSNFITTFLFDCTDSNDLKLHRKAVYRSQDSTFIFYVGESLNNYNEMWEIPLKGLSFEKTDDDSKMWDKLEIKGSIKYNDSISSEFLEYHTVYLYEWCNKRNETIHFELSLNRMIELCN